MAADQPTLPLWDFETGEIFRKGRHDYMLVVDYIEKSMGGKRWHPGDIAYIEAYGATLVADVDSLMFWERKLKQNSWIKPTKAEIKQKVRSTKLLCQDVLEMIYNCEENVTFGPPPALEKIFIYNWLKEYSADDKLNPGDSTVLDDEQGANNDEDNFKIKGQANLITELPQKQSPTGAQIQDARAGWDRTRSQSPQGSLQHRRTKYGKDKAAASKSNNGCRDSWRRDRDGSPERPRRY